MFKYQSLDKERFIIKIYKLKELAIVNSVVTLEAY